MAAVKTKGDALVPMRVEQLCNDLFTETPLLILKSDELRREIALFIGSGEATAIAAALKKIPLLRPSTHDLMNTICERAGLRLLRVEIRDLVDETYYAAVVVEGSLGVFEVDARPSDAVAFALRAGASILVARKVLDRTPAVGVEMVAAAEITDRDGVTDSRRDERYRDFLETLPDEDFGKWKM